MRDSHAFSVRTEDGEMINIVAVGGALAPPADATAAAPPLSEVSSKPPPPPTELSISAEAEEPSSRAPPLDEGSIPSEASVSTRAARISQARERISRGDPGLPRPAPLPPPSATPPQSAVKGVIGGVQAVKDAVKDAVKEASKRDRRIRVPGFLRGVVGGLGLREGNARGHTLLPASSAEMSGYLAKQGHKVGPVPRSSFPPASPAAPGRPCDIVCPTCPGCVGL